MLIEGNAFDQRLDVYLTTVAAQKASKIFRVTRDFLARIHRLESFGIRHE
jgi:hypothetical protein